MSSSIYSISEKKNQKKSRKITFWIHAGLLALLLFPFLNSQPEEPTPATFIVMEFDDFTSAAKKSSTKKATQKKEKAKKKVQKKVEKKKTVPKPKPTPVAEKKPVLTDDTPETPIETKPNKAEKKVDAPMEKPKTKIPEVTEEAPEETEAEPAAEAETADADGDAGAGADTEGSTDGNGEGTTGDSDSGDSKTDGVANEGDQGLDFSGDGIFNRKVIYRPDINKVIKEEGKIVINVCISREGRVVYAKYNSDRSTIETPDVVRKAISATTSYKYARDYTAPKKQCGRLTFNILSIDEEE